MSNIEIFPNAPAPIIFDRVYGSFLELMQDEARGQTIGLYRYVLIKYCDTLFSEKEKQVIWKVNGSGGVGSLSESELIIYNNIYNNDTTKQDANKWASATSSDRGHFGRNFDRIFLRRDNNNTTHNYNETYSCYEVMGSLLAPEDLISLGNRIDEKIASKFEGQVSTF